MPDNSGPPAALAEAMRRDSGAQINAEKLADLREMVHSARALEAKKKDLEETLKATNISLNDLYHKGLPDLLDQAGVPSITIAADGNYPAVEATAKPFYHANIAVDWDPERRDAAFAHLEELEAGDLIRTEVTVTFPRDKQREVHSFVKALTDNGFTPIVRQAVIWSTLTAWLRERYELAFKHPGQVTLPDLNKIGAIVGRVVKLKEKG